MGRVLAVRPDPPLVTALGTVLDLGRHQLEFCSGSAEAIRRVRERAIDVVVTDPVTPIEEDLALATEVQQMRPAVRTIVLAPEATQTEVVTAIRANVFACFTCPYDYGEIASMTGTALQADNWRDGIQVVSGLPYWLTLRASCHLLTADRLVRFMTELQASLPGERDLLITAFREMLLNRGHRCEDRAGNRLSLSRSRRRFQAGDAGARCGGDERSRRRDVDRHASGRDGTPPGGIRHVDREERGR